MRNQLTDAIVVWRIATMIISKSTQHLLIVAKTALNILRAGLLNLNQD